MRSVAEEGPRGQSYLPLNVAVRQVGLAGEVLPRAVADVKACRDVACRDTVLAAEGLLDRSLEDHSDKTDGLRLVGNLLEAGILQVSYWAVKSVDQEGDRPSLAEVGNVPAALRNRKVPAGDGLADLRVSEGN